MLPAGANPDPLPSLPAAEPTILAALADPDLPGVSPEFTARLSAETEDLRAFFEERAGILEYDAGLPRPKAELEAARITATLARNRGYL